MVGTVREAAHLCPPYRLMVRSGDAICKPDASVS
jgi:hypothetical protein